MPVVPQMTKGGTARHNRSLSTGLQHSTIDHTEMEFCPGKYLRNDLMDIIINTVPKKKKFPSRIGCLLWIPLWDRGGALRYAEKYTTDSPVFRVKHINNWTTQTYRTETDRSGIRNSLKPLNCRTILSVRRVFLYGRGLGPVRGLERAPAGRIVEMNSAIAEYVRRLLLLLLCACSLCFRNRAIVRLTLDTECECFKDRALLNGSRAIVHFMRVPVLQG